MAEVPRYGTHDGIKYSPRRTLVRWCNICGRPYIPQGRRDKTCSEECRYIKNKGHNDKWNPITNPITNAEWNPINNAKRSESEEAKYQWARKWIMWYHSLPQDARNRIIRRMQHKNRRRDDYDDEYASIQREMAALGLR